eukprot:TRINITY_DN14246_c0_g1_i1.p1 TRINITY_DN14246_c0_g1~~TRINITY_DN14246_c0_g1_i1.p1  ORF type:complete len:322 (-),score=25.71 TRINITY_DN14246_c0_g1_i1:997-1962(-)
MAAQITSGLQFCRSTMYGVAVPIQQPSAASARNRFFEGPPRTRRFVPRALVHKNDDPSHLPRRAPSHNNEAEKLASTHTHHRNGASTASAIATGVQQARTAPSKLFDQFKDMAPTQQELVKPQRVLEAWYTDDSLDDPHLPHKRQPHMPVSWSVLSGLGLSHAVINSNSWEADSVLEEVGLQRGCQYQELVTLESTPGAYVPRNSPVRTFFREHIHAGDEIRCVLEGSGYLDVRDLLDRWVRIHVCAGDLVVIPAGMYHRISLDAAHHMKLLCVHNGSSKWTPLCRPQENHFARKAYLAHHESVDMLAFHRSTSPLRRSFI